MKFEPDFDAWFTNVPAAFPIADELRGEWLARNMPQAHLVKAAALGRRRYGDPLPGMRRLYAWPARA